VRPQRADARRNREKILAAAASVVAERGHAASTEEIAGRAGVAVGTVFRHFPTKNDLLAALMKDLSTQLLSMAVGLAEEPDGLFRFALALVERAASQRTVVELLAAGGIGIDPGGSLEAFRDAISVLIGRGQKAALVRADVRTDDVLGLLTLATYSAMQPSWDPGQRSRVTALMLDGLRA
jgi:AcrR family transcriptional regulator